MLRLTCMNVLWAAILTAACAVFYTYFLKHQPHSALLTAIKAKDHTQFDRLLTDALSTLPTYHPPDAIHFGEGRSLAHAIAMHGTERMLQRIHTLGFSLTTASSSDQRTPLHVAAMYNTPAFLALLCSLEPPASVDPVAGNGFTPLHYAVLFSQLDNARELLERGADANARVGSGLNAVQMAVVYSSEAMVEELVEHGATLEPGEGYAKDVQAAADRLTQRRATQQREEEEEEERANAERKETSSLDATLQRGEYSAKRKDKEEGRDGLEEGQRMKARHWAEKQRMLEGGPPFEPWEWEQ